MNENAGRGTAHAQLPATPGEAGARARAAARHAAIRTLVRDEQIHSQSELQDRLAAMSFRVTQATLSRDLKLLAVGKLPDGRGGYVYTFRDAVDGSGSDASLSAAFMQGFQSLAFSANLAVIRTLPGHGGSVAFALDKLQVPGVLGTVAGDDTIIAVLADGVTPDGLRAELSALVPALGQWQS